MSQYAFVTDDGVYKIVVGWDNPLQTFFGQVWNPRLAEDDGPLVWVGTRHHEIRSVEHLAAHIGCWCPLPATVREALRADEHAKSEPTPLQRHVWALFEHRSRV